MFKNLTLFKLVSRDDGLDLEAAAQAAQFVPCEPTQPRSIGFVPPREAGGAMVEAVAGELILAVMIETRTVPASAVDRLVREWSDRVERETGRKPGRKARGPMKDEALRELLPQAFPKQTRVLVWIDRVAGRVVLDTASIARADEVATLITQTLGVAVGNVQTVAVPAAWMRVMLVHGDPSDAFVVGRDCLLEAPDGEKPAVRYTNSNLDDPEVRRHLKQGKVVRRLGLEWLGRASFVLDDASALHKVEVTDATGGGEFDADVAITAGTLRPMLDDLIDALGGEVGP